MSTDPLSLTFAALAHPARRKMLARLSKGEATVTELARPLSISLPAVSRHLKVLEKSGLISRGKDAQWRPCRLEAKPIKRAEAWLVTCRTELEGRLDRLEQYLEELQTKKGTKP